MLLNGCKVVYRSGGFESLKSILVPMVDVWDVKIIYDGNNLLYPHSSAAVYSRKCWRSHIGVLLPSSDVAAFLT
jgi:hypothetical protein